MNYTYDEYTHEYGTNKYKITESGTAYDIDTPDRLVMLLERLLENKTRIVIYYGKDGKKWGDKVACHLGRSNGKFKVPLAIKQRRSTGGEAILTDCIALITLGGHDYYRA